MRAQELGEGLEIFREVWAMALSATRNRIIRLNLAVTVATFALTVCIMPASWFGMNIAHGLSVRGPLGVLFGSFRVQGSPSPSPSCPPPGSA